MQHRFLTAAALSLAVFLAACGSAVTTTPTTEVSASTQVLPTNLPISTSTAGAALPTATTSLIDAPNDLSGHELIAQNAGEGVYSGYICTITPIGCACETAVLLRAEFIFKGNQRMEYHFAIGGGEGSVWEFTDIGPNHWEYTLNYIDPDTELTGTYKALLSFTEIGYVLTELARFADNSVITCPDVAFRRIATPTDQPDSTASPTP